MAEMIKTTPIMATHIKSSLCLNIFIQRFNLFFTNLTTISRSPFVRTNIAEVIMIEMEETTPTVTNLIQPSDININGRRLNAADITLIMIIPCSTSL